MEKKIVLTMDANKDITVSITGNSSIHIPKNNRCVKADEIFSLLDYSRGDTYLVSSVNDLNLDKPVLDFFEELIKDIVERLNSDSSEENGDDSDAEEQFDESCFSQPSDNGFIYSSSGLYDDSGDLPF